MAKKAKAALPVPVSKSKTLQVEEQPGSTRERLMTNVVAQGLASNAATAMTFAQVTFGELSLTDMVASLKEQGGRINANDMGGAEQLLTAQAIALNAMFAELSRRAALNMGEYMDATEKYLRLALKAQSQSRATLETLAVIKNPPVFAAQANIAHGPQQVNNGSAPSNETTTRTYARAHGETEIGQDELLEDQRNGSTYLEPRAATTAARSHTAVASVGECNGAEESRRQGTLQPQ